MLLSLGGRQHYVYTGLALIATGDCILRPVLTDYEAHIRQTFPS